jgi:ketosteroid isomerase-like protein
MRQGWVVAAVLALAACTAKEEAPAFKAHDISRTEARAVVDDLNKAFASGDSMQIMAHYAPGAVIIDAGHLQPTVDRQLQTQWTAQFATMHPADFLTSDLTIQPMGPDSFVATGLSSFTADVGAGRDLLHVRFMQAFRKQADGQWRVVAEHISLPPPGPAQ